MNSKLIFRGNPLCTQYCSIIYITNQHKLEEIKDTSLGTTKGFFECL